MPPSDDREVLGSLPNTRPQRRSAKRDEPAAKPRARPKADATPKAAAIPPAGYATPRSDDDAPHGTDLVTTAVQAVGELAQIGIEVGGRAIKAAVQRLPRP